MKINVLKKRDKTIYRIGKRIECYVVNNFVNYGKPSDKGTCATVCFNRKEAESYAMEWCRNVIIERMKYENPCT